MMLLPLMDNPLFLKHWRERMRPYYFSSALVIALFILFLIFVGNYVNQESLSVYNHAIRHSVKVSWMGSIIYHIASLEGVVILLLGTISAYRNTTQEISGGTIDCHRASPVRRLDQAVGAIFGSAILEWVVFGLLSAVMALTSLFFGFGLKPFFQFHIPIVVTAIFLHTLAVWAGLYARTKKQGMGLFGALALLYFVWMMMVALSFMASQVSAFYHATWLPVYERLHLELLDVPAYSWRYDLPGSGTQEAVFYGIRMPSFLLQLIVQLPLWWLALAGIKRRFSSGEKSVLSKTQFLALYILILFYYLGSIITVLTQGGMPMFHHNDKMPMNFMTIYLLYGFMFWGVFVATPDNLNFTRGLARARKMGLPRLDLSDDKSSNSLWALAFCMATVVFWGAFAFVLKLPSGKALIALALVLCHVLAFSSALEAFRLSRFHHKKVYFWTALGILWVGIPLLGLTLLGAHAGQASSSLVPFFALSPLFDVAPITEILETKYKHGQGDWRFNASLLLVINFLVTFIAALWVTRERARVYKEALGRD